MLGPTGVGVLYGKPELLDAMEPVLGGGGMIDEVTLEGATWAPPPERFEAGTPNIADVVALSAAIDYLNWLGMENVRAHEVELTRYALETLREVESVRLYGPSDVRQRGGVVAFNYRDVHPHDVSTIVDQEGIAIRAGHHCCQPLMHRLGEAATARASFYVYNTPDDVDALAHGIRQVREVFDRVAR
jgi:cysteine desulfurase/selenocysteine lyase